MNTPAPYPAIIIIHDVTPYPIADDPAQCHTFCSISHQLGSETVWSQSVSPGFDPGNTKQMEWATREHFRIILENLLASIPAETQA